MRLQLHRYAASYLKEPPPPSEQPLPSGLPRLAGFPHVPKRGRKADGRQHKTQNAAPFKTKILNSKWSVLQEAGHCKAPPLGAGRWWSLASLISAPFLNSQHHPRKPLPPTPEHLCGCVFLSSPLPSYLFFFFCVLQTSFPQWGNLSLG